MGSNTAPPTTPKNRFPPPPPPRRPREHECAPSPNGHTDPHTIDCVGYTDDVPNARYGLVYRRAPITSPDLDARVALACTLSGALWSLHSLGTGLSQRPYCKSYDVHNLGLAGDRAVEGAADVF
ncbi:hypothetical protein CkaCkLH20_03382 [Colletotrichum karsti]|uniref:Uncharacterized protein n=1 Tax=Colletotrichum karsti TaxID=1095194 RepID=A0A9P6LK98_9PEZI|nr:uncharacterized protein CkaCkLH20_03382 [Colletotrichum karsti]KAF9879149.1 hypothetical protein CkaCkLH20_03382 [Colletotrichum karsti]